MELSSAIALIRAGVSNDHRSVWADLGAGSGLFTRALGTLLAKGSTIFAVDTNFSSLQRIPAIADVQLKMITADFDRDELNLGQLDGLCMANALHFVKDKHSFIRKAQGWLKREGCIILVEYDTDTPNPWVPYPLSFASATKLFPDHGYKVEKIGERPSVYQRAGMYAAQIYV